MLCSYWSNLLKAYRTCATVEADTVHAWEVLRNRTCNANTVSRREIAGTQMGRSSSYMHLYIWPRLYGLLCLRKSALLSERPLISDLLRFPYESHS
jgi:hypothetical protein